MTTDNIIVSPQGTIVFSRLRTPAKSLKPGADYLEYSVTMDFDLSQPGVQAFKDALEDVNSSLIVTKPKSKTAKAIAPGHFRVSARTKNRPTVFDHNSDVIAADDVPMISGGTGTMIVTTFEGNSQGGGLNLQGVQLLTVEEYVGNTGIDESALQAKLRGLK